MTRYFAELDPDNVVVRVVVCSDPDWLATRLGGIWVETSDPYTDQPQEVAYCGPGWGHDGTWPLKFGPAWRQPVEPDEDGRWSYNVGSVVWHNGTLWASTVDANVWEPGLSGWRPIPTEPGIPAPWVQPSGSHDAYRIIDGQPEMVTHLDTVWATDIDSNVWEPPEQWTEVVDDDGEPEPWVQPEGSHDAYQTGDRVTHNGQTWESTIDDNVWEPGTAGTESLWVVV